MGVVVVCMAGQTHRHTSQPLTIFTTSRIILQVSTLWLRRVVAAVKGVLRGGGPRTPPAPRGGLMRADVEGRGWAASVGGPADRSLLPAGHAIKHCR